MRIEQNENRVVQGGRGQVLATDAVCQPGTGATRLRPAPYFTDNPGDPFKAWDASPTFDYMPSQYTTFRWELDSGAANVPYFSGPGGITPPGGNTGALGISGPGFRVGSPQNREQARFLTAG
jgi:hypothetical protein